jgi:simple sugar transport system permease protein
LRSISASLSGVRFRVADRPEAVVAITFLLLFVFFSLKAGDFFSAYAISNFLTFGAVYGVVAVGIAFLMICGEFDLSVGSTMAVTMYVLVLLLFANVPALIAIALALLVGALLGFINGLIVVNSRIPSFIVTLGSMLAYRGVARFLGKGRLVNYSVPNPSEAFTVLNGPLTGFNNLFQPAGNFRAAIIWFILLTALLSVVLMRTRFGNWTYAVGGNPGAALTQGINVKRVRLACFTLSGVVAGFAGILFFSHRFSVNPLTGYGLELVAVAAAVIGGVRLTGGYGTIAGAAVGVILMSMLEQALASMGIAQEIFEAVTGLIVIFSVLINTLLSKPD